MSNIFASTFDGAVSPTLSDTVNDPLGPFAGLYVGGAGDVKVRTVRGQDVTFKAVPGGTILYVQVLRVWSTGTGGSTNILGLQAYAIKAASS